MKKLIVSMLVVTLVGLGAFSVVAQDKGPEVIKLPAKMGEVTFPHSMHQDKIGVDCAVCHHQGAGTKCTSCHGQNTVVDGKTAPKFMKAAHKNCRGCHEELAKAGKPAGPTKKNCKGCHSGPKKKK